jgi:hypothetical protein
MENLANIALTVIEEVNKTFNDSLSKAKEQLKDMKPEEAKIVNEIIGKIEKLMKNVKMPSIESLKNPSELQRANNEIIHKLGEIQKELQNLQKVCLL